MDGPKSIVTGVAGFIGSHLAEKLLAEGHDVTGIDCLTDYYGKNMKLHNLQSLAGKKGFKFLEKDILDVNIAELKPDYVFHLAAQPGVRPSWESFGVYVRQNILATQHVLEDLKGSAVKRLVVASSSSVYGDCRIPMKEEYMPMPISPYGVTKLAAESLCYSYHKSSGMPITALRYFTVYGPRQRPDMAINRFIKDVLTGGTITIYGDGEQRRDFTYVGDAVKATFLASRSKIGWDVLNIGGSAIHSINEIIRMIEDAAGKKATVMHTEKQKGDVAETLADITRARRAIGYEPETGIEEGIKRQVEGQKLLCK